MQHALAELGAGGVPGQLEQMDPLLGLDAGALVIARDVGADRGAQVGLGRADEKAAGRECLRHLHDALIEFR